jgi:hypothetical protein
MEVRWEGRARQILVASRAQDAAHASVVSGKQKPGESAVAGLTKGQEGRTERILGV